MPNSDSIDRCTEELRAIRSDMANNHDYLRGKVDEIEKQVNSGVTQVAVSAIKIAAMEAEQQRQAVQLRRIQDPTPLGNAIQQPNWIVQAAVIAVISVLATSACSAAVYGWAKHVTATETVDK